MVLPAGASTPAENAPPRIGAGSFGLSMTLPRNASSSPRLPYPTLPAPVAPRREGFRCQVSDRLLRRLSGFRFEVALFGALRPEGRIVGTGSWQSTPQT